MSDYKVGDHLKVAFEGVVTHTDEGIRVRGLSPRDDVNVFAWVLPEHVEKLPDPEPEWKRGTLVRLPIFSISPLIFSGNAWHLPGGTPTGGEHVSDAWKNGTLKILWQPEGD